MQVSSGRVFWEARNFSKSPRLQYSFKVQNYLYDIRVILSKNDFFQLNYLGTVKLLDDFDFIEYHFVGEGLLESLIGDHFYCDLLIV